MGWGSNFFPLLIITSSGGFTGLFIYSPTVGLGKLIESATASTSVFTDPYGNSVLPGHSFYTNVAGTPSQALSIQNAGNILSYVNTAGAGLPATWSQVSDTNLVGGITVTGVSPSNAIALFGSIPNILQFFKILATQTLISATSAAFSTSALLEVQGSIETIDSFATSMNVKGMNSQWNQLAFNNPGLFQGIGGTPAGTVGPGMIWISPTVPGAAGTCSIAVFGLSADTTRLAGVVLSAGGSPVRATSALLEVQGPVDVTGATALHAALTVTFGGASITGGLAVATGGLSVSAGASSVLSGSVAVNEGSNVTGDALEVNGVIALANFSTPAAAGGYAQLWSDSFTQLHTDRAFVSQVNVETANLGSPPGAGGSGAKFWSSSGYAQTQSGQTGIGGDTNVYDMSTLTLRLTATTVNQTTFTQTLASKTLGVGKYRVHVHGNFTEGAAAGIPEFAFTSAGTVTDALLTARFSQDGTAGAGTATAQRTMRRTAIGTANFVGGFTMSSISQMFDIWLDITFSVGGLFSLVAATTVAADTFTTLADSDMQIQPIVAT